jgi:hypothetical protein
MADPQIQLLDLTLTGGESQNQDERTGDGLLAAQDVVYRRRGGIQVRPGQEPLAPLVRTNGFNAIGNRRDALVRRGKSFAVVEGNTVRPYADDIGTQGELGSVGPASAYYVEYDGLEGSTTVQEGMQVARSPSGYLAVVWIEHTSPNNPDVTDLQYLRIELFSEARTTLISPVVVNFTVNQMSTPQVHWVGGHFIVTWIEAANVNTIKGRTFDALTGALGPITFLMVVQFSGSYAYRSAPHSDGTSLIVVGGISTGAADPETQTNLRFFSSTLTLLNTPSFLIPQIGGVETATAFGIYTETPSRVWFSIAYSSDHTLPGLTTVRGDVALVDGSNPAAPVVTWVAHPYLETQHTLTPPERFIWATSVIEVSAIQAQVAFSRLAHDTTPSPPIPSCDPSIVFYAVTSATSTQISWAFGCILESDLWKHSSGAVFCEVIESTATSQAAIGVIPPLGSAHLVCTLPPATAANSGTGFPWKPCSLHGTFAIGQSVPPSVFNGYAFMNNGAPRYHSNQAQIVRLSSGEVATVVYVKQTAAQPSLPKLARFSEVSARSYAELQGIVLLSGGTPTLYDGQSATEYGMQHIPQIVSITNTGAGSILPGDYVYAVEYQWITATGAVMHSLVHTKNFTVAGANSKVSIALRMAQLSHKPDNQEAIGHDLTGIAIILYRTIVGSAAPFYRLTSFNVPFSSLSTYGTANLTVEDDYPDTGGANGPLAAFPQMYTSGEVLQAFPAPSARFVAVWLGRYVLGGTDDDSLHFSTEAVSGEVPYFSPALRAQPWEGGRVTGLAVLDDKLIVFKRNALFVLQGQLPDQRGQNGSIPAPTTIATDSGCLDPYSVVVAPPGVFFRSERGIQLLDRGLNLSFIGENVAADIEQSGPVIAPLLVPDQTQVRFDAPVEGQEGQGPIVVYDYLMGSWQRWLVDKYAQADGRVPVASVALDGRPYWLDAIGTLWRERFSDYRDGGGPPRPLSYRYRSAWIRPSGMAGYFKPQAIHVLGLWGFPHRLTITMYVDFDSTSPACSTVFDLPANPAAGYEFRASITSARAARVQACSVAIDIGWDSASSAAPQQIPAILSAVSLELLPLGGGQRRIPATQKG